MQGYTHRIKVFCCCRYAPRNREGFRQFSVAILLSKSFAIPLTPVAKLPGQDPKTPPISPPMSTDLLARSHANHWGPPFKNASNIATDIRRPSLQVAGKTFCTPLKNASNIACYVQGRAPLFSCMAFGTSFKNASNIACHVQGRASLFACKLKLKSHKNQEQGQHIIQ